MLLRTPIRKTVSETTALRYAFSQRAGMVRLERSTPSTEKPTWDSVRSELPFWLCHRKIGRACKASVLWAKQWWVGWTHIHPNDTVKARKRGVIPKKEPHGKERPGADMDQKWAKQRKRHCAGHPGSLYKVVGHKKLQEAIQRIHTLGHQRGFKCITFLLSNCWHSWTLKFRVSYTLLYIK